MRQTETSRKLKVSFVVVVAILAAVWAWNHRRQASFDLQKEASLIGLSLQSGGVQHGVTESTLHDVRLQSKHGMSASVNLVRLVHPLFGEPSIIVDGGRFTLRGALSALFDEWQTMVNASKLPISFVNTDVEFEDRFFSHVQLKNVSFRRLESGYHVQAAELRLGEQRWRNVEFSIAKPKAVVLVHFGGAQPSSRPYELRYVPTPGVAWEWILDIPSQPLSNFGIPGFKSLPCARATGVLSIIVPENPQLKMRGRLQSVADDCKGPDWVDSNALFGGTVAVAFNVEPQEDHRSWELRSVEFTSAMFELKGLGKLSLEGQPELSFEITGSRNCAQLQAHLAPSSYLDQVKAYLSGTQGSAARKQALERELVTLSMSARVKGADAMQRDVKWHLSGNCGISSADGS